MRYVDYVAQCTDKCYHTILVSMNSNDKNNNDNNSDNNNDNDRIYLQMTRRIATKC